MASLAEQKDHTLRLVGKVDELAGGLGDMEVRGCGMGCDATCFGGGAQQQQCSNKPGFEAAPFRLLKQRRRCYTLPSPSGGELCVV